MDKENWSKELPTEVGFYWLLPGDGILDPEVVEVEHDLIHDRLEVLQTSVEGGVPLFKYQSGGWLWAPVSDHPEVHDYSIDSDVGC